MTIQEIIKQPEGRRLEFKEQLSSKADISKTIIAFANDAGGVLYVGIKDNPRIVVGVSEETLLETEELISNIIFDNCYPIIHPDISVINLDGKLILKVEVFRGNNMPYYLKAKGKNNGTYIRVGSSNRLANEEIITELERLKRNISFDSEPILDLNYEQLSLTKLEQTFINETGEKLNFAILKKLRLISEYQSLFKATNALVLLSDGKEKGDLFPYAKVECARFKGTSSDIFIDQKTFDGNLIEQAEMAYEFVMRHINKSAIVEGIYTKRKWEYPVKAIREAIRNAIVHRDYSLSGKDIKIAIYDDMVEITSPGKLLPSIDFNKLYGRQSDVRNKTIAPVFKHLGIIDQWGNGLKLIGDELAKFKHIKLEWNESGMQFQLQFIDTLFDKENTMVFQVAEKDTVEEIKKSSEKSSEKNINKIFQLIKDQPEISARDIALLIGISQRAVEKNISKLRKKGILNRVGPAKGGYWEIVNNNNKE